MSYTQYSALKSEDVDGLDVKKLRENEYIAYTAVQMLSKDKCLKILSQDKSMLAEAQELLPDMEEEEALCYLHESVETVAPFPKSDHYEIGYPAKFSYFFEHEDSMPLGIIRHGIFLRNTVLSDDTLYSELRGEDGSTGQIFKKHVRMSSLAHVKKLKENIAKVLQPNPVWQSHILRIIEEIKLNFPNSEIDISIFNPGTGILTIYNALTKKQGFLYLPKYFIIVKDPEKVRLYFGALEATSSAKTFSQLLTKYYDGNLAVLLLSTTWGGRDERNSDIIEDLGAQYRSYQANITNGKITEFFTLREDKWRHCEPISLVELFKEYTEKTICLLIRLSQYCGPIFLTSKMQILR